jgi:protoheme IX farnesyltransferase
MKPGIILGNLITTAGGFALASRGTFHPDLFLAALLGLSLVIGSACAFNNYIDREADGQMARTKNRPLVQGAISPKGALVFAAVLGIAGSAVLAVATNLLTLCVALFGFLVYVLLYSFSKYHSIHGTLIGSIAGAVPPVVGYCAVSNSLDAAAWILFGIIVAWQMPHFFAIAIYRLKDYEKAGIPVLPLKKGMFRTKIEMIFYVIGFTTASSLLTVCGYTGKGYLLIALALGIVWLALAVQGLKRSNEIRWARQMFIFSLVVVTIQFLTIPFSLA